MAIEKTIGANTYQINKLSALDQVVLSKNILPVFGEMVTPDMLALALAAKDGTKRPDIDAAKVLPAIIAAISKISDEAVKKIVGLALQAVYRKQSTGWSPMTAPNGAVMFNDLELPELLELVWSVVEVNLGSFFATAPSPSPKP